MSDVEQPKIEFPCDYPIKVIVEKRDIVIDEIFCIAQRHDPDLQRTSVRERDSRNGNYLSITLPFRATGERQLKQLFEDLKQCDAVRMVL